MKTDKIKVDDFVIVPDPDLDMDSWSHSFHGRVIDIFEDTKIAIVEDGDSDCYAVELKRLIKDNG